MKVSNILIILLGVFLISAITYDKVLLINVNKGIDKSGQFSQYNNVIPLKFNHVVAIGGNYNLKLELHQRKSSVMRYKKNVSKIFTHRVKNDTLFINFKEKFTNHFYTNWSKNKLIVLYDSIASFTYKNNQNYIYAKKLKKLKITAEGVNYSHIQFEEMDSLDIEAYGKSKIFSFKSKVNYLKISANDTTEMKLKLLKAAKKDVEKSENTKVEI